MTIIVGDCTNLWGNCSLLEGNCSSLRGDCTDLEDNCNDLYGDCTGLEGDLDFIVNREALPELNDSVDGIAEDCDVNDDQPMLARPALKIVC